uniref:Reverse transcriptase zinc-binding domain-containing protein n=1 Tax=Nicotiana tabacum TaxID=4097 RepID=A0A1S3ZAY8_TOBAC
GDLKSVQLLYNGFQEFSQASGLKINKNKSSLFCGGITQEDQEKILSFLGIQKGELPVRYLGVPLSTRRINLLGTNFCAAKENHKVNRGNLQKLLMGREKNKLWIQWIHSYYIKDKEAWGIQVKQASWMVGKILKAQETLVKAGFNHEKIRRTKKCNIKTIYHRLRGTFDKVRWKKIACQNLGCPRCTFMLTLTAHGKLYTRDRLQKWGMHVEEECVLCRTEKESIQHLFFECEYSKAL